MKNSSAYIQLVLFVILFSLQNTNAQYVEVNPQPTSIFDHPAHDKMVKANSNKDYKTSLVLAAALIDRYSHHAEGYMFAGRNLLELKDYGNALIYAKAAYYLEPTYRYNVTGAINAALNNNDGKFMNELTQTLSFLPSKPEVYQQDLAWLKATAKAYTGYPNFANATDALKNGIAYLEKNATNNINYYNAYVYPSYAVTKEDLAAAKGPKLFENLQKVEKDMDAGLFLPGLFYYTANNFAIYANKYDLGTARKLRPILTKGMVDKRLHPLTRFSLYKSLVTLYDYEKNNEEIVTISNIILDDLKNDRLSHGITAEILYNKTKALRIARKYDDAAQLAETLATYLPEIKDQALKIRMYTAITAALATKDGAKAEKYAREGLAYVTAHKWNNSTLETYLKEAQNNAFISNKKFDNVEIKKPEEYTNAIQAYNAGAIYLEQQNYPPAIPFFLRAKELQEEQIATAKASELPGELKSYSLICSKLVGCYKQTEEIEKIVPIAESMRAYGLAEATSNNKKGRASTKEIQATLSQDEALIYYVDVSQGSTYEGVYVGVVVTKENVEARFIVSNGFLMGVYAGQNKMVGEIETALAKREFRAPKYSKYASYEEGRMQKLKEGELGLLIEVYRHNINPDQEEVQRGYGKNLDAMAHAFYGAYVDPLEDYFKGKKKLIFSLDGELNFLPFETFMDTNNAYLVEKYQVAYINSGTVLRNLRQRKVKTYPKNILAFGDAKYAARTSPGKTLKSVTDIDRLRLEVAQSLEKGDNVDYAFATFSKEAASYLIGTKKEVEMIAEMVPKSDVRLDTDMTENELKKMSAAGELNNYKVIHLASHASVHGYIFDLSGIMFSVYPTPKDGEDGVLVVDEVAKLNMQPELVMLSACQTGLGKIVPGEGIAGLNYSFLTAGANATLTSLWSVNDYATAIFVENLYKKIFTENTEYKLAMNEVKREFITGKYGEQLKAPQYWAPFVYYGK